MKDGFGNLDFLKTALNMIVNPQTKEKLPDKLVYEACPQCGNIFLFDNNLNIYCKICGFVKGTNYWEHPSFFIVSRKLEINLGNDNIEDFTKVATFCKKNNIPFNIILTTRRVINYKES